MLKDCLFGRLHARMMMFCISGTVKISMKAP
jgi:hypothetical protein